MGIIIRVIDYQHYYLHAMKAQPLRMIDKKLTPCLPKLATHIKIRRPGPMSTVIIPVNTTGIRERGNWIWNGDVDKPTIRPSICVRTDYGDKGPVCHSWVKEGVVHFLNDSNHSLAGTNCDLIDIEPIN